jgi:predicted TIM-barrel fold metal-dependent hydrolase
MVWGSGWPHTIGKAEANDAHDFDLNLEWAPDAATRARILVRNPEALYGFSR